MQSVRVTYAHKKRRKSRMRVLLSSPLPTDADDITRTQMVRCMLKRSRRVALAEQLQDKNVEHLREHVAKRIRHIQNHISDVETPFASPRLAVDKPAEREQLSPVPRTKRTVGRTGSRRLKENDTVSSQTLDSPFNSRPGSTASSPKHKGRARISPRVLRYMRCKLEHPSSNPRFSSQDERDAPPSPLPAQPETSFYTARSFASESPMGSIHSPSSFYTAQPQSISTPAILYARTTGSPVGHTTGSFIAEYRTRLVDVDYSPPFSRMINAPRSLIGDLHFPGTSPAQGQIVSFRTCKRPTRALTPPALLSKPSTPASDLAQELGSMDIGDLCTQSDGETRPASASMPVLARGQSLRGGLTNANSVPKIPMKRRPGARNRAGTIRPSDFVKEPSSSEVPGQSISALPHVRRTRSGTVVGPESKLAAVPSSSESESDDELLLKSAWLEDMVYLGLSKPVRDSEADELNLSEPPRRQGPKMR